MGACLVHLNKSRASMAGGEWERETDEGESDGIGPCKVNERLETDVNVISLQKGEAWNENESKTKGGREARRKRKEKKNTKTKDK